jgi:hypothetical protein
MRLLTGLILPEQEAENLRAIGRGEREKVLREEPWLAWCEWPLYCTCKDCRPARVDDREAAGAGSHTSEGSPTSSSEGRS